MYFEASEIKYLPFRKLLVQQLDAIYPISVAGVNYISVFWRIVEIDKIQLARLGTKLVLTQHRPIEHGNDQLTVVSCSNVIPLKRVQFIFEVLNRLSQVNMKWIHFGDGSGFEDLKEFIAANRNPHLEINLKGRCKNQAVIQTYLEQQPKLFMNLSTSEGVPVSIMEAMSCGIPVLATNVGGTSEIVNSDNGWLISKDATVVDIELVLLQCLNLTTDEWKQKSLAAYNTWSKNYNAAKNFQAFCEQLQL